MNKQTTALLRTSFAEIARRRPDLGAIFYKRLFEVAPDLRRMFSASLKEQHKRLKASLAEIAQSGAEAERLEWLGERQAELRVKPAHYKIVGDTLLWTFQQALQQDFTQPIRAAWVEAYKQIAQHMIAAEAGSSPADSASERKPRVRRAKPAAEGGKRKAARRPVRKPARRAKRAT
jgi:hemoglobin-like flavoprotein